MSKTWALPRSTYDALAKLHIQRSPAIAAAAAAAKADPGRLVRALQARLDSATYDENPAHTAPTLGSTPTKAEAYVRVSVCYQQVTEEAIAQLSSKFQLSQEETVRLILEAYIKHL